MTLFDKGTPLEVAVILAIIYFAYKISASILPMITKDSEEKIDKILSKLDSIEEKQNEQNSNIMVHSVRFENNDRRMETLERRVEKLEDNLNDEKNN